jgi:hypothetical protein
MAKQNRYANKAAQQIEVGGRKLRTDDPEHVRRVMEGFELRKALDPNFNPKIEDRQLFKGVVFEAIRLKGIS